MDIEIRYIHRTCLEKKAYNALLQKYTKGLKYNLQIVFDNRIVSMGHHYFDNKKKIHIIRISPKKNKYSTRDSLGIDIYKLSPATEKYNLIGVTLHEIKHAKQFEEMGSKFHSKNFTLTKEIRDPEYSNWYSRCELEARTFESKNLLAAIEYYNNSCK